MFLSTKFTFLIAIAVGFSLYVYGETEVWSDLRKIESISQDGNGASFVLSGDKIVPSSGCINKFRIDSNDPEGDWKIETLISAKQSGRKLRVSYIDTSTACSVLALGLQLGLSD